MYGLIFWIFCKHEALRGLAFRVGDYGLHILLYQFACYSILALELILLRLRFLDSDWLEILAIELINASEETAHLQKQFTSACFNFTPAFLPALRPFYNRFAHMADLSDPKIDQGGRSSNPEHTASVS